ncbi:MAG: hypothetical protein MUQ30_05700, partial [Anaerolineae bacterium]|nr:hypothetical protein [Anaerolineae bacterium]
EDLSLVTGGPAYRAMVRARLASDEFPLLGRRVAFAIALTWLPLLAICAAEASLRGQHLPVPFLGDLVAQVRFLVALPLLIVAEPFIGARLADIARQFTDSEILPDEDVAGFSTVARSISRLRDSGLAELILLGLAYSGGLIGLLSDRWTGLVTWRGTLVGGSAGLTGAGWWYMLISMPLFRFLVLRWAYRFCLWTMFLWKISRLRLQLSVTHPDGAGGLGFLAASPSVSSPIIFALGCILSAAAARRIIHAESGLLSIEITIGAFIVLATLVPILPLLAFAPELVRARWRGILRLGRLGETYAQAFDEKWTDRRTETGGEMLGTSDIQTLADLNSSFDAARRTRLVPVSVGGVLTLAASAAAPMAPLLLLFYPVKEVLKMLLGVLL